MIYYTEQQDSTKIQLFWLNKILIDIIQTA